MGRNKKPRRNHQQQYAQLRAGLFDLTPLQPAQRDRNQRQIDHATRLFLLGLRLTLRLPTESASTRPARLQRDRWSDPEAAPLHPSQIGGDWSDRSISAPPTRTLSLDLTSKPAPDLKIEQGPVRSLASYAADVVASHLEEYDETLWTDGEGGMELQAARLVVRSLQEENEGELDLGNWVRFVGGYGPDVLSPPSTPSLGATVPAARLHLNVPHRELVHGLTSSPPTCALLDLNNLSHFNPAPPKLSSKLPDEMIGLVLTSLDLSDSSFGDADCKAIKDLRFLTVLNIERTSITDAGIRLLTSALYVASPQERKGLHRLKAWSLNGCRGVTDRAATSFRAWTELCYIDVRRTSANASAFLAIINRSSNSSTQAPNATAPPANSSRYTLSPPPDLSTSSRSSLLEHLLNDPSRFSLLPKTSAICTITTKLCNPIPDFKQAFIHNFGRSPDEEVERPRGIVPNAIVGTSSRREDVVIVRRSASLPAQEPTVREDVKRKATEEVAQLKRRRFGGSTPLGSKALSTDLFSDILGRCPSSAMPSSSSPTLSGGRTPSRPTNVKTSSASSPAVPTSSIGKAPSPISIASRPFQTSCPLGSSSSPASSSRNADVVSGFNARRPTGQGSKIGDGSRGLKASSIFRGQQWS